MTELKTFVRSSGEGDNLVCLHSCLGSSKQWSALMDRLAHSFRVSATDLYGYGKGPAWNLSKPLSLDDDVDLIAPMLDTMDGPIHLLGHSYGAAVAIKTAQRYAHKIQSLTLYEPVLFTLLFAGGQTHHVAGEIFRVVEDMKQAYRAGDADSATRIFIDYWSDRGSWDLFSAEQQGSMSAKAGTVIANFGALLAEANAFATLKDLHIPTLCLYGEKSPKTTIKIARIIGELMPDIQLRQLAGMGHMGPITHSDLVNEQIESYLQSQSVVLNKPEFHRAA